MAVRNQSPAGQTSITVAPNGVFDSITFSASGGFRAKRRTTGNGTTLDIGFGGTLVVTEDVFVGQASLIGRSPNVSPSGARGMFTLMDQIAAKRRDAWPTS